MECDSLGCGSEAIVKSRISGMHYCIECGLRAIKQNGPGSVARMKGSKLPWEEVNNSICSHCKASYNKWLVGYGSECPRCRRDIK